MKKRMALFIAGWALAFPLTALAFDESEIFSELSEPVTVQTRMGRSFSGSPVKVSPTLLILWADAERGGLVEYTFAQEDIVQIRIPGSRLKSHALDLLAAGQADQALNLIDLLYAHRRPFFPYLHDSDAAWFADTVRAYREHGRSAEALERAEDLLSIVQNDDAQRLLSDEILLNSFLLGEFERAHHLALAWTAQHPRGAESALGWFILGTLLNADGQADAALFTWLRPVVFSGRQSMSFLPECYAGAIEAALGLGREDAAVALQAEMSARELAWPEGRDPPRFSAYPSDSKTIGPSP